MVEVSLPAESPKNASGSGISLHAVGFEIQVTCDFDQATLPNVLTGQRTLVMFGFSGAIKFYYCPTPISMRKSFDGLTGTVEEYIR